jgi:hypothetical protein
MICAQLISFVLVCIYYKKKTALETVTEELKDQAVEVKSEKSSKNKEKLPEAKSEEATEGYSAKIIPDAEAISPNEFKDIVTAASDESSGKLKSHNGELPEDEIDDFLKNYGQPKHHYHPPTEAKQDSKKIDDDFNVDDFLKNLSNHK